MSPIVIMILFAAVILTVSTLALLNGRADVTAAAQLDLDIYKGQLRDLERDIARGIVSADEAASLKTEIARRILDAQRRLEADGTARDGRLSKRVPIAVAAIVLGLGGYLYTGFGTLEYPDMPLKERKETAKSLRENRPSQADYMASLPPRIAPQVPDDFVTLVEQLREAVNNRPTDIKGLALLAQNEARLGKFEAAIAAQGQVLNVKGDTATANDYADLAEYYISQANGYVSPEAENALTAAYRRDETHPRARFYLGLMFYQTGRPDTTFRIWAPLLAESKPSDPWYEMVSANIMEVAAWAGEDEYQIPAPMFAGRGPTSDDIEAAAGMSEGDRASFIESMVAQLNDRLASEGGPAEEWAKLINALGVLGRTEQAAAIYGEAKTVFAGRASDLAVIEQAASAAGVAK